MTKTDICKVCGKSEKEHHDFEPWEIPEGCICDPRDWRNGTVPAICECFVGDPEGEEFCERCEHDVQCHRASGRKKEVG